MEVAGPLDGASEVAVKGASLSNASGPPAGGRAPEGGSLVTDDSTGIGAISFSGERPILEDLASGF